MPRNVARKIKVQQANPIEFRPVNLPPNITPPIPRKKQAEAIERTWYGPQTERVIGKFRPIKSRGRETSVDEIV
jgi:hypothetical protein